MARRTYSQKERLQMHQQYTNEITHLICRVYSENRESTILQRLIEDAQALALSTLPPPEEKRS